MHQRQYDARRYDQQSDTDGEKFQEKTAQRLEKQAEHTVQVVDIIHVLQQEFQGYGYRTIESNGPALSLSPECVSASTSEALLDSFACAMARWKSSQRWRADSFFNAATGDSDFWYLFDIL